MVMIIGRSECSNGMNGFAWFHMALSKLLPCSSPIVEQVDDSSISFLPHLFPTIAAAYPISHLFTDKGSRNGHHLNPVHCLSARMGFQIPKH